MDVRNSHKPGQTWRVRFINENSGRLNTAFYRTYEGASRRVAAVKNNPDLAFVDLSCWLYGPETWVIES